MNGFSSYIGFILQLMLTWKLCFIVSGNLEDRVCQNCLLISLPV